MPLYSLTPTLQGSKIMPQYDVSCQHVVVANHPHGARQLVHDNARKGDEIEEYPEFWLDSTLTHCIEVNISENKIIASCFHNG